MPEASTPVRVGGEGLARISTGLVQLYARHCGKGPTRAKTLVAGDSVVCVLRDAYTTPERTLIDAGEMETVQQMRTGFHRAMRAEARQVVEEACGRQVIAQVNAIHADPDIAVEVFVLEPLAGEEFDAEPSAAELNGSHG